MRKRFGVGGVRGGSSPRCRGASDFKSRTRVYPSTHRLSLLLLLSNPIRVNEILGEISNRDAIPFSAVGAYLDEISALTRNLNFAERRLFAVVGSSNRFIDFVTDRGFYGPEGTENFGSKINIITSLLSGQVWRNGFKERGGGVARGSCGTLTFRNNFALSRAPQHNTNTRTHARTHDRSTTGTSWLTWRRPSVTCSRSSCRPRGTISLTASPASTCTWWRGAPPVHSSTVSPRSPRTWTRSPTGSTTASRRPRSGGRAWRRSRLKRGLLVVLVRLLGWSSVWRVVWFDWGRRLNNRLGICTA